MWEFRGGLVVRIPGFQCHGLGSTPGQGTDIPQAEQRGPKKKPKQKTKPQNQKPLKTEQSARSSSQGV